MDCSILNYSFNLPSCNKVSLGQEARTIAVFPLDLDLNEAKILQQKLVLKKTYI